MKARQHLIKLLVIINLAWLLSCTRPPAKGKKGYIAGGRNIEAHTYQHSKDYPAFPDKARFIGTLQGDWFEMGRQFGQKAGESTRYVSDIWWKQECERWGRAETLKAFGLYEAQITVFDPNLVKFMKGISEGAAQWLDQSPYADSKHPLYATNYQRVLAVNLWDAWTMMHPRVFPDGAGTCGGKLKAPPNDRQCVAGCSAFAARGKATMNGVVISAHDRHSPFDPRTYQQVYILKPDRGLACWVLTNSPQLAANQVVNEKGVSISLLAGGQTSDRSLKHASGSFCAEGFGVPWFHLFLFIGTQAESAEQAIEMLTRGTEDYRRRSGCPSLLRCGGWNFLVADGKTLAVVEATANRYAVRYAGDESSFTGPDWKNPDYIVVTNHYICDFSYDKNNVRTAVPMTIFNDGYGRDSKTGEVLGINGSGQRFWTLLWDLRYHFGRIDRYRAQQIMSGTYAYHWKTGEKIEVTQDRKGNWNIYGRVLPCTIGRAALWGGTNDAKIAVLAPESSAVYWTLGNPNDWQGAWDTYRF